MNFVLVSNQLKYVEKYVSPGNELSLSWNVQCYWVLTRTKFGWSPVLLLVWGGPNPTPRAGRALSEPAAPASPIPPGNTFHGWDVQQRGQTLGQNRAKPLFTILSLLEPPVTPLYLPPCRVWSLSRTWWWKQRLWKCWAILLEEQVSSLLWALGKLF